MNSKIRKFLEKHPIMGMAVLYILSFFLIQYGGLYVDSLIVKYVWSSYPGYIVSIAVSFLLLWYFKRIFYPDYDGSLHTKGILKGILLMWPYCLLMVLSVFHFNADNFLWSSLFTALWAGINEDIIFRGIPVAFLTYHYKEAKHIPIIALVTGLVFGGIHLFNIFVGGSIYGTILQTVSAVCLGMLFAAVFMRTGTLWPPIIIHAVNDFLIFMTSDSGDAASGTVDAVFSFGNLFSSLAIYLFYALIAIFLMRPKKRGEIVMLWDKKWNRI